MTAKIDEQFPTWSLVTYTPYSSYGHIAVILPRIKGRHRVAALTLRAPNGFSIGWLDVGGVFEWVSDTGQWRLLNDEEVQAWAETK